jgi:hypothetical protein
MDPNLQNPLDDWHLNPEDRTAFMRHTFYLDFTFKLKKQNDDKLSTLT